LGRKSRALAKLAAAKTGRRYLVEVDLIPPPEGPVTDGTVKELEDRGFSGELIEIAQQLAVHSSS
jgi:hypothetical protein